MQKPVPMSMESVHSVPDVLHLTTPPKGILVTAVPVAEACLEE